MNTQLVNQGVKLTQWAATFKERNESGLTISQYCEEHNLSKNQYYYWLRKVRKAAIEACPTAFAEILPPEEETYDTACSDATNMFQTQMIVSTGEIQLSVNESTPPELIASVLGVIRGVK